MEECERLGPESKLVTPLGDWEGPHLRPPGVSAEGADLLGPKSSIAPAAKKTKTQARCY